MELAEAASLTLNGVALGGIYAIQAYALFLILRFANVLNISHGTFFVFGAALLTLMVMYLKLSIILGIILIAAMFILVGLLFSRFIVAPISGRGHETLVASIITTFALSLILEAGLSYSWTKLVDPNPIFIVPFARAAIEVFGVYVSLSRLILLLFSASAALSLTLYLKRTYQGKAIRAIACDPTASRLVGIDVRRITTMIITFAVTLAAVSGSLYSLVIGSDPYSGTLITLWALIVMTLGGMSLLGVLIGGIAIGLIETFIGYLLGTQWAPIALMLLFLSLAMLKPTGLLGEA